MAQMYCEGEKTNHIRSLMHRLGVHNRHNVLFKLNKLREKESFLV